MRSDVAVTSSGSVRGSVEGDSIVFRGIPYAAPPFGERLWRLPEPPEPWSGVRDCLEFGPVCPQPAFGGGMLVAEPEPQGEDCLLLNIWTPADDTHQKRPVMFWIHGGAYMLGSGSAPGQHGHTFSRDGVVFVSINYRLGAAGFLHTGALRADCEPGSGNYGIADQVAALRWVRENIAGFGGDPDNITIFGVSAGGNYVQALTACPQAKGLFRRGISESAGGTPLWGLPPHVAAGTAEVYFELLGKGPAAKVDLAALTPAELLDAQAALLDGIRAGKYDDRVGDMTVPFYPVSGTDHQPVSVIEANEAGATADVDLVIGINHDEMTLFKLMEQMTGDTTITPRDFLDRSFEPAIRAVYRATEPNASDERIDWTVDGDRGFRIPNWRAAESRVRGGAKTWTYEFAWESPAFDGRLGAAHGLEVAFVFDDTTTMMAQFLTGGAAPVSLATTMHEAWIAFATTGVPTTDELPEWPEFDLERRATAVFDEHSTIGYDHDRDRRLAWEGADIGHRFPPPA